MSRNPFGVPDVPDPDGDDVTAFASGVRLSGSDHDENANPRASMGVGVAGRAVGWLPCLRETRCGAPRAGCTRHWPGGC